MALTYYIPDWDDRVDPGYDFVTDQPTPGRNPYINDRYAHEMYTPPPYDGVLLSRAVIDAERSKRNRIRKAGTVHDYLRLPQGHSVLGDCGAFSYWRKAEPPYQTDEMLEYYQTLGFDLGVAIDHLIFAELEAEKERRWNITMHNCEEFLKLHRSGGYTFTPIGVAQGWDPASYARAAAALMKMGYRYIAVGGLVRSQTADIIKILHAVQSELRMETQVHLFGVSRPEHALTFAALGVTSFDSASRLRRAWMDGRKNYFLGEKFYTAIRVPEAERCVKKHGADFGEAQRRETKALAALRAYDRREGDIEEALHAVASYAELAGPAADGDRENYRATLVDRPWDHCACQICQAIRIEVIILRGNNRNRRRGFHNTWQLYQDLQSMRGQARTVELAIQEPFLL